MAAKGFGQSSSKPAGKSKPGKAEGKKGFGSFANAPVGGTSSKRGANQPSSSSSPGTKRPKASSTMQEDVVRQTEEAIRRSMDQLKTSRPFVWEALELKKRLTMFQSQTANLNVLQLADLPPRQVQEMRAVEAQLRSLQEEHDISDRLLHNIAQEATWDASARAKDDRQANVQLPLSAVEHMQALVSRSGVGGDSRVMDVGAGTGILLRFLQGAGVDQDNFVGVDLAAGMVEVAKERYPKATFVQGDFLDYCRDQPSPGDFTHVFFNGCLHNFLEPGEALVGAARLLKQGGKIVISHPKGASNVDMQRRANPMLVPNRLPTEADLERACEEMSGSIGASMKVIKNSRGDGEPPGAGYLQVLQKFHL
eukprot:jgi/Undpi1/825/HiC_scaffold_10.g04289.m1